MHLGSFVSEMKRFLWSMPWLDTSDFRSWCRPVRSRALLDILLQAVVESSIFGYGLATLCRLSILESTESGSGRLSGQDPLPACGCTWSSLRGCTGKNHQTLSRKVHPSLLILSLLFMYILFCRFPSLHFVNICPSNVIFLGIPWHLSPMVA